ncbi:hypothetical protein BH10BAC6_BH10BAC6_02160 [soil metagenome]
MSELVVAILLWLGVMQAPSAYTTAQYQTYSIQNAGVIQATLSDEQASAYVWQTTGALVSEVRIIDPLE